jgi:pimeloyl-ACP methyl ester carboxylesterase
MVDRSVASYVNRGRAWLGRNWRRLAAVGLGVVLLAAGGLGWYFSTPHHARNGSVADVRASDEVSLSTANGTYVLAPTDNGTEGPRTGLVFYPGGRVHPDAYLPSLAPLAAEAGVTVYVTHPPLNLAVLDPDAADTVMSRHPGIDRWYVGGHSLGGAMACRFADGATDRLDGLVLFAAYCDRDVSDSDLRALSVTGSEDAVLNRRRYRASRSNLPPTATVVELDGVNHSQFGAYTGQRGDQPSGTSYETAHDRLADVVVPWFEQPNATRALRPSLAGHTGSAGSSRQPHFRFEDRTRIHPNNPKDKPIERGARNHYQ